MTCHTIHDNNVFYLVQMDPRFDRSMALLPWPRSHRLSHRCPLKPKADAQILRGPVPIKKEPSMEETPKKTMWSTLSTSASAAATLVNQPHELTPHEAAQCSLKRGRTQGADQHVLDSKKVLAPPSQYPVAGLSVQLVCKKVLHGSHL